MVCVGDAAQYPTTLLQPRLPRGAESVVFYWGSRFFHYFLEFIPCMMFYRHDQAQRRLQKLEETVKLLGQQLKEKRDQITVYVTDLSVPHHFLATDPRRASDGLCRRRSTIPTTLLQPRLPQGAESVVFYRDSRFFHYFLEFMPCMMFYRHDQAQRRLQRLEETVKLLEQQLKEKRDQIAVYVTHLSVPHHFLASCHVNDVLQVGEGE